MTETPEVVEGEAQEVGQELELAVAAPPATLFRTDDPAEVAKRASEVADALKDILQKQNLTTTIQGREHVRVEGWQTLGAMLGVTPVCVWTREIERGWEARVEARTLDGRVIGAAEAMCSRDESTWAKRDDYALRSMAQTRATSKALGSPLRFVVTLAGYDGTPAEEMHGPPPQTQQQPSGATIPDDRARELYKGVGVVGLPFDRFNLILGTVGAEAAKLNRPDSVAKAIRTLTSPQADQFERLLQREADRGE